MTGVAPLQLTVSDGSLTASAAVALLVTDSSKVLIDEPFAYSEGSLVTNSGHFWNTRSGKSGKPPSSKANCCYVLARPKTWLRHFRRD
jgi:hypothetical protein